MTHLEQEPSHDSKRSWAGIPVNWDWKNWNKGVWNAQDHRLFPPKRVGIGWTINFRERLETVASPQIARA
jgi:uncharacterized membrane protein